MTRSSATTSLPVSSLVGSPVADVRPGATLVEVAKVMHAAGVGALVVRDGDGAPSGIVSERDLVEAVATGRDLSATTAGEVARSTLVWCDEDASVAEVAAEMMDEYVRHVLVEADGRLLGVVSARDLLGVYASEDAGPDLDG
ncbi:MAG TPA: CBS domain-containing protein [Acidimicrobiales bacterium]|nr:CBS domain-containing protein [Acidimicrobiales bacterium]